MKALQISANLAEIQSRLNKYAYLSKNTLPGSPDGKVFLILQSSKRFPDRKLNPNFYHWYILMRQFSQSTINKWINDEIYYEQEDSLINQFIKLYSPKKENSEPLESHALEARNGKIENVSEVEYAIDIALKDYNVDKINNLRKLLEEYKAEMTEDENNSKYIRILCKIDPANLDQFSGKISKCIEFNQLSLRKKDMKAQKLNSLPQQKGE